MRGISTRITHEEFNSKKAQIETMGTSKEVVMEGDPKCTNLIEAVMCDTIPVQYICMVSE